MYRNIVIQKQMQETRRDPRIVGEISEELLPEREIDESLFIFPDEIFSPMQPSPNNTQLPSITNWNIVEPTIEVPTDVVLKAQIGRQIVSRFPESFLEENRGRFVAVTFKGKFLTVSDTLHDLIEELSTLDLKEDYYIERIGYKSIAQI